ncbi:ThiF family adenylyltransferase [Azohydromonas australica]|uniref:ThiF family adenylyltransferase n=1 Tax=Azohydromonas australica TaxID=364039 RepID=UPI001EE3FF8D|nr:ThiF family adenylyltransferase [Azohydromonas australica]
MEIRADNWLPYYTGADMVKSAYRLLYEEAHIDDTGHERQVASAHGLTQAQSLRFTFRRLVQTKGLTQRLTSLGTPCMAKFQLSVFAKSSVWRLTQLNLEDGSIWTDPDLPQPLVCLAFQDGVAMSLRDDDERLPLVANASDLGSAALWRLFADKPLHGSRLLVLSLPSGLQAFHLSEEDDTVSAVAVVDVDDGAQRLPLANARLLGKRVAVLGGGSVGSKVATTLARAGVRNFLLIDGDILCAGNLVRNDLDWRSVGAHKVEGLKERLEMVASGIHVDIVRQNLGDQEAGIFLNTALRGMSFCDFIVEATGSARAFNYAAAVAEDHRKPMAWARVFGGGFGGLIARSRPGLDPAAQAARDAIDRWCANPAFPEPPRVLIDYGIAGPNEEPMVADDADVSVVAAHFARFVIDTMANEASSEYEHSAYMIGLREAWIFSGAFDTHPIDLGGPSSHRNSLDESWLTRQSIVGRTEQGAFGMVALRVSQGFMT